MVQAAARHMHRDQPGRACGIDRQRRSVQTQRVRDPPGRHSETVAHEPVRLIQRAGIGCPQCVVVVHQPDEHTGPRAGQGGRINARMFEGLPRRLQQQAVLRIYRGCLALADAEKVGIEAPNIVEERTPPAHRTAGQTRLRIVVLIGIPTVKRNLGDEVVTAQQRRPQRVGGIDRSGQPTGHTDDSNRGRAFVHRRSSSERVRHLSGVSPLPITGSSDAVLDGRGCLQSPDAPSTPSDMLSAGGAFRRSAASQKLTENDCYYQPSARLAVSVRRWTACGAVCGGPCQGIAAHGSHDQLLTKIVFSKLA